MKNYIVLMIIGIVLSKPGLAQAIKDSIHSKKNELTADLIPLIKLMSQADGKFDLKGSLQYKRQLKNKMFLRVGIIASQKRQRNRYTNINVSYADSSNDAIRYEENEYKPELNFDAGIEYRWGKRRIKQFTGMDIGYTYTKHIRSTYEAIAPHNPNNVYGEIQPNGSQLYTSPVSNTMTGAYVTTYNGVFLNPFYGVQFHFSRRFFFSMQLGVQLQVLTGDRKIIVNSPAYEHNAGRFTTLDFEAGNFLNNFSLGFRF